MTSRAFYLILLVWLGSMSPAVALDMSVRPNAKEMAIMPPYCVARLNSKQGSPEWNYWSDRLGENFLDVHHYCFALVAVNRYWGARTKQDRGFYLQRAMNNFDYIAKAAKPDFPLRAEVHSGRGEVFKLKGMTGDAIKDFHQAIAIEPTTIKPYLQLSDLYLGIKDRTHALEVITDGLRNIPDSKALQKRYLELGGKEPFPEPIVTKVVEPELPPPVAATPVAEETVGATSSTAASQETELGTATEPQPTIGSPKNPYCRFCAPE